MNKRLLWLLTLFLLAAGTSAEAQQAKKVPRIGYVMGRSGPMEFDHAFQREMRELGYVEGQNIVIEYRFGEGKSERYHAAQRLAPLQRIEMERFAGTLLETPLQ